MSLDTVAVASAIKTLLENSLGIGQVLFGAPLAVGPKVSAYITIGSQINGIKTQGTIWRDARYFVDLCYRCDDSVQDVVLSEGVLMAAVDNLLNAVNADRTLGGTCHDATVDMGLADEPEYRVRAGKEFREYPIVISCRQYGAYAVNP